MLNSKHTRLILQKIWRRRFQSIAERKAPTDEKSGVLHEIPGSNWRASLEEKLKTKLPRESGNVSIYRVPTNMRQVEPKAYDPNIISIGPYHHGVARLQAMEELKCQYFRRLLNRIQQNGAKFDTMIDAMKKLEQEVRSCYSENLELSSDKFVEIMLIDGCFIIEFFREIMKHEFKHGSVFIKRWMLPILRRDLIMLENQLPKSVLCKLFDLTSSNFITPTPTPPLQELALRFFDPLMPGDSETLEQRISAARGIETEHFLHLFRSSILPRTVTRGKEPHMFRSITELKEAGIKVKTEVNCHPLELSFEKRVLKIPPLYIDDYRGTLFRNIVAFEQCHSDCKPDVTTYLFFIDGLINSDKDVGLLHYAGVIQHSLGSSKQVARLVNKLCREVSRDNQESYLHKMVGEIDHHCKDSLFKLRAKLVHDYFSNPWASVSTFAAIFLLYLTLLDTCCEFAVASNSLEKDGFWFTLKKSFSIPFSGLSGSIKALMNHDDEYNGYECMFS